MIELDAVTVECGGVRALDAVSLAFGTGAVTALAGPNGGGKTTLIEAIAGVRPLASGAITLDGERVDGAREWTICARGIARTHQAPRLFSRMTVRENVQLGARLRQMQARSIASTAEDALRAVGYAGSHAVRPSALGEADRRLVEIARALATAPRALLLDEPFAGATAPARADLGQRLAQIARDRRIAIVIAERDLADCFDCADHALVLHAGRLIARGAPRDLAAEPDVRDAYLGVEWRQ